MAIELTTASNADKTNIRNALNAASIDTVPLINSVYNTTRTLSAGWQGAAARK